MKYLRKKSIIIGLIIVIFISGLLTFLFFGRIPIFVNSYQRLISIRIVTEEGGFMLSYFYFPASRGAFSDMDEDEVETRFNARNLRNGDTLRHGEFAQLIVTGDSYFSQNNHLSWRTLYRDGESTFLAYLSITRTPMTLLRRGYYDLFTGGLQTQNRAIPVPAFQDINDFPQRVEIYYLRNLHRLWRINWLSDENFDALRADGTQIWYGVIGAAEESSHRLL